MRDIDAETNRDKLIDTKILRDWQNERERGRERERQTERQRQREGETERERKIFFTSFN